MTTSQPAGELRRHLNSETTRFHAHTIRSLQAYVIACYQNCNLTSWRAIEMRPMPTAPAPARSRGARDRDASPTARVVVHIGAGSAPGWPPCKHLLSCMPLSLPGHNPHRSNLCGLFGFNQHRIGELEKPNKTAVYNRFKLHGSPVATLCDERGRLLEPSPGHA